MSRAWIVLGALLVMAGGIQAQRPRIGVGATGGMFLGSQLVERAFTTQLGGRNVHITQQLDLYEVPLTSIHGEWYVTPHLALRAHGAWGEGDLEVSTLAEGGASAPGEGLESEFSTVRMQALDAGVSVWPWAPRSTGFTPFVTVGIGTVRYGFDSDSGYDGFFQPLGDRSRQAFLLGIGADMEVWSGVMLRLEAINHRVDSPFDDDDFEVVSDRGAAVGGGDDQLSNVRLVLGAHMYFPFGKARTLGAE